MGRIKTKNGTIRFKTIPLYPGVKIIDKEKAAENLKILKQVLDRHEIQFQLQFGTLLGAMREHDFISHDEDIDLALLDEDRDRFFDCIGDLNAEGFRICRYDHRDLVSVMRNGEYIDLYFFKPYNRELRQCSGWLVLSRHLENSTQIDFKGGRYNIPRDWEENLVAEYGNDWRTPMVWNNYDMPPLRRMLFALKEHLKDILPTPVLKRLSAKANQKLIDHGLARLHRNLGLSFA